MVQFTHWCQLLEFSLEFLNFGIVGIFIGPLLIAYFLLFFNLYMEEYLGNEPNKIKKAIR